MYANLEAHGRERACEAKLTEVVRELAVADRCHFTVQGGQSNPILVKLSNIVLTRNGPPDADAPLARAISVIREPMLINKSQP